MTPFLNRIINAVSLMAFALMTSTGFLLEWVLPHGSGRAPAAEAGRHQRAIYTVLGLDRHDWATIHFYISLSLIFLLCVHLILHRKWIVATAWGTHVNPQPARRRLITVGIVIFIFAVLAFPWLLRKEL